MRIQADRCDGCGLCVELCPMAAVRKVGGSTYEIDPARCTECVGDFDQPCCAVFCRMNSITLDPARFESRATLLRKWRHLSGGTGYGQEAPIGLQPVEDLGGAND